MDQIVLIRRRSPDWSSLAQDYEAGNPIDPLRYKPTDVPGLPPNLTLCIDLWNALFPVNFFRVRQQLKAISERLLGRIQNALVLPLERVQEVPAIARQTSCVVFFFDDDDLFDPEMFASLAGLRMRGRDIAVFPLVRLGQTSYTLAPPSPQPEAILGSRKPFRYRYHTNNYGIPAAIARSEHFSHLQEHVHASCYADQLGLVDEQFGMVVSATNKTPCSLAILRSLPFNQADSSWLLRRYVSGLQHLRVPSQLSWLEEPVADTLSLFDWS